MPDFHSSSQEKDVISCDAGNDFLGEFVHVKVTWLQLKPNKKNRK